MKKATAMLALMLIAALNLFAQEATPQEKDFQSRLEAFQKSGDLALLQTIWYQGDGAQDRGTAFLMSLDNSYLERVILQGVKSVKFVPVYPSLKDTIINGVKIEGGSYVPNLVSYKMIVVEYLNPIKNGSTGFSLLTGMKDGKIMICGYKKSGK